MAIWVLLQTIISVATGYNVLKTFETNQSSGIVLNHLVFDKRTGSLFVGAVNRLYKLNSNLTVMTEVVTGPKEDNPQCVYYRDLECNKPLKLMNSYNKVLVIDYTHQKLIACSSLYQGFCEKRNLANIKERDDPIYTPVVANNDSATTFAFIANGPAAVTGGRQQPVLYIGASRTNTGAPETRNLVHAFCSRKLSNFELVYKGIYSSTKMDIDQQQRDTFPIYYRYGFGSQNFSYQLTVQRRTTSAEGYVSKLIRVCQDDKSFFSYAEVQLECERNGIIYNVAQAAYLAKSGFLLAKTLEIPITEDVLYIVFSKSLPNSASPGRESAMCMYQMRRIRSIFTENIHDCFQGIGNTGPGHVIHPSNCLKTTLPIDEDYCGTYDINTPIDGRKPIRAGAAVTFDGIMSAIAVSITNEFTVAFVGTSNGHILKINIRSQTTAVIFENIPVDEGRAINADLRFDDLRDPRHLYCMTDYKISKLKLSDCSRFHSCGSCLGAGDPYCGWCTLENKCSVKKECSDNEQENRWIQYNGSCTRITDVTPDKIQKKFQTTEQLQLNISNMPSFTDEYQCVFSGYGISTSTRATWVPSSSTLYCDTPLPHLLPVIQIGEDHVVVNLSVQIQNQVFVSTNFTFFDCTLHTSCTNCTLSAFPCTWCINNHMCTHSRSECQDNDLVIGDMAAPAGQTPQGHALCPRVELNSSEILVPSGMTKKIILYGVNLKVFQSPIRCLFNLHTGREVAATVRQMGDRQEIECGPVSFQYSSLLPNVKVPFQIIWANNKPLDNPAKIQVILYKCGEMADTCGDCLMVEDKYGCGWCEKKCMTEQETCGAIFLPNTAICPDPHIDRIYPTSGPREGGTLLTIEGTNLGKEYSDISGGITVAMVQCTPDSAKYVPPRKIVCRTGRSSIVRSGTVEVTVKNTFAARASEKFSYINPEILGISPSLGPMSGGTWVSINGRHLNAGTDRLVDIGSMKCEDTRSVGYDITCRTSGTQSTQNATVTIMFDNQMVNSNVMYSYMDDPEIVDVKPKKAIVSGGITVTVTGTNLHTIQDPQMLLWDLDNKYISECKRTFDNGKPLLCYSPNIDDIGPVESTGKKFGYGFQMDNVSALLNLSETKSGVFGYFTIFPDPTFKEFPGNKEKTYHSKTDYLTISGEHLILGISPEDVTVKVGREFCNVTSLGTQLTCQPPKKQPASLNGSKYPEVVVQVGRNLSFFIGYLAYPSKEEEKTSYTLPIILACSLVVVALIVVNIIVCILRRRALSKKARVTTEPTVVMYPDCRYTALIWGQDDAPNEHVTTPVVDEETYLTFKDQNLLIQREELRIADMVGKGNFGCVFMAYLKQSDHEEEDVVAVKTLHQNSPREIDVKAFLEEAIIMKDFHHKNVLELRGVCLAMDYMPLVVLPYMANGDLLTYIRSDKNELCIKDLLQFGLDIANGMDYLSSLKFVHRDLAARNCMLDSEHNVKVADFGLSRDVYEKEYYTSDNKKTKLPVKWMAPECLDKGKYSSKSDVWSYGIVLWELTTRGVNPYPGVSNWEIVQFLKEGFRLQQPVYCPDDVYRIMRQCWVPKPGDRLDFTEIAQDLQRIIEAAVLKMDKGNAEKDITDVYVNTDLSSEYHYSDDKEEKIQSCDLDSDTEYDDAISRNPITVQNKNDQAESGYLEPIQTNEKNTYLEL